MSLSGDFKVIFASIWRERGKIRKCFTALFTFICRMGSGHGQKEKKMDFLGEKKSSEVAVPKKFKQNKPEEDKYSELKFLPAKLVIT